MTKLLAILLLIVVLIGGVGIVSLINSQKHSPDSTTGQTDYTSGDQNNPTDTQNTPETQNNPNDPNIDPSTQSTTGQIYPKGQSHPAYTDINGNFHAAFTSYKDYYDQHDPGYSPQLNTNYTTDHPGTDYGDDEDPSPNPAYYGE